MHAQLLSHVWLFATPWIAACQASLSITVSQSLLKHVSIEWYHSTISSPVVPFSSCLQSFLASGSFPMSQLFVSGSQSIGVSASASVLPVNIQGWFPLGLTGLISLQSKWLSSLLQKSQFKSIDSSALSLLYGPAITSIHEYWKNHNFVQTFVSKVISFVSNTLSRFVVVFSPRSKHLSISWLESLTTVILELKKMKSVTVSNFSLSICHKLMWPDAMLLVFWMPHFKPAFPHSSFTIINRLFSSYTLSAIGVVSSAYMRLLIFPPTIWIQVCDSSCPVFCMMYSAYKLNKQGDNIQPWYTPFPILNQSVVPWLVLAVASWPAYRFLRKQVTWSSILFYIKNFPQFVVIHTVKGFSIVNEQ